MVFHGLVVFFCETNRRLFRFWLHTRRTKQLVEAKRPTTGGARCSIHPHSISSRGEYRFVSLSRSPQGIARLSKENVLFCELCTLVNGRWTNGLVAT